MSRRRSSRKKKSRRNHIRKANNILVFKLVDPICQSLLFIFFMYCLDSDNDITYQPILTTLTVWQILSGAANLLIKPPDQLRKPRIAFLITILSYMIVLNFVLAHIPEKNVVIGVFNDITIPLYHSIYEMGLAVISFWYYIICFKEIRAMLTSITNEAS